MASSPCPPWQHEPAGNFTAETAPGSRAATQDGHAAERGPAAGTEEALPHKQLAERVAVAQSRTPARAAG